jgi:putative SOS response-associated peptidase YedK
MCGRVIRTSPVEVLKQLFDLTSVPDALPDRYNLAPTDPIPVIRYPRELELLRWGLEMPNARMAGINARVESLSKPLYREKLRDKRCLIVTDGFYEWRSTLLPCPAPVRRRLRVPHDAQHRSLHFPHD